MCQLAVFSKRAGDCIPLYLKSIELKNGARHLKEHPNVSNVSKFESYWSTQRHGSLLKNTKIRKLSMDWRGSKFGKVTNVWMDALSDDRAPFFNSIEFKY